MGSVTQEYSKTSRMKAVICLVLLAVCISLSTASSYTYTLATSYEWLGKYDCKNNNIKYVKDTTLEKCQLLCDGLTDCKAVMMVPGKKYCYLKKSGCLQHKISNHICQLYEKEETTYSYTVPTYSMLGKYDCKNNNLKYLSGTTLEKCQEKCNSLTDCAAVMMVPSKKILLFEKEWLPTT